MKAMQMDLTRIPFGLAVGHPFGNRLADAAGMGQPRTKRSPQPLNVVRFAHNRVAINGEGKNAVKSAADCFALERGEDLLRPCPRLGEIFGGEGIHCRAP